MILNISLLLLKKLLLPADGQNQTGLFHWIPELTGKARSVCVHMDVNMSWNYDDVKIMTLTVKRTVSDFALSMWSMRKHPKSSTYCMGKGAVMCVMAGCHPMGGCSQKVQPEGKTFQQINEIIILEQYLRMLSP